jgi:NADP-dependent aldehyde dehydrogenase
MVVPPRQVNRATTLGADYWADRLLPLLQILDQLKGQLTGTIHCTDDELIQNTDVAEKLRAKVGRLVINQFPTGVEVCPSMVHGGPFPAASDSRFTAVGTASIQRFLRPVCYQNFPEKLLPPVLHNHNALNALRTINGVRTRDSL